MANEENKFIFETSPPYSPCSDRFQWLLYQENWVLAREFFVKHAISTRLCADDYIEVMFDDSPRHVARVRRKIFALFRGW